MKLWLIMRPLPLCLLPLRGSMLMQLCIPGLENRAVLFPPLTHSTELAPGRHHLLVTCERLQLWLCADVICPCICTADSTRLQDGDYCADDTPGPDCTDSILCFLHVTTYSSPQAFTGDHVSCVHVATFVPTLLTGATQYRLLCCTCCSVVPSQPPQVPPAQASASSHSGLLCH